ncbi:MAG: hypothetical protein ACYDDI_03315 [Candidatus Acidiferrales bacterium]
MNSRVDRPDSAASQNTPLSLREGYERYGARIRNRVIAGLVFLSVGLSVSVLWHRFPHGTFLHEALIWSTATCFGAAEFSLTWARLLYRSWLRGKRFTAARLGLEIVLALATCAFFALYVLDWMKW